MKSTKKSLFKIIELNQDIIKWKLKKTLSEIEISFWVSLITLLMFFIGVYFLNFNFNNKVSIDITLSIPIIVNLIIVFIDIIVISITYNWHIHDKHLIIPDNELSTKKMQILVLFILIVIVFVIFIIWIPKISTSFIMVIFYVIFIVIVLITLSIYHLLTIFFAKLALTLFNGNETITINYKSKFIKKEKKNLWNKAVEIMYFNELTSLSVIFIEIRKLPYCELVLNCKEKSFQIATGTRQFLTNYATELQKFLNLPIKISQ